MPKDTSQDQDQSEKALIEEVTKAARKRSRTLWLWIWIAVFLLVSIIVLFVRMLSTPVSIQLAEKYYQPYLLEQNLTEEEAYKAYKKHDYSAVVETFKVQSELSPVDHFYFGIALMETGQYDLAIQHLSPLHDKLPQHMRVPGIWYLALSHLALDKSEAAQPYLEMLSQEENRYKGSASAILRELKEG